MQEALELLLTAADSHWASSTDITVANSLSWDRDEWLKIDGNWAKISVPAFEQTVADCASVADFSVKLIPSEKTLENDFFEIIFDQNGAIESILDKTADRSALQPGKPGNVLSLYYDDLDSDAWDFRIDFENRPPAQAKLVSRQPFIDGPTAVMRSEYKVGADSRLYQDVVLTLGSRRIDFKTKVDWAETHKMLRVSFPVNVVSTKVTCDIQFGTIERPTGNNTTWDAAVSEIAAHKWVDLSEPGYGVALLNDCKYGHQVKGNVLDLNLLRSSTSPDPVADKATHEFTYSLLPHTGDHVAGRVMQHGYELNIPLRIVQPRTGAKSMKALPALLAVSEPNIIVETVKRSEDGNGFVVRLYESTGAHTTSKIRFGPEVSQASLTDLIEKNPTPLSLNDNSAELTFGPFEIHTVKVS
jgi:alpha-mannosidase